MQNHDVRFGTRRMATPRRIKDRRTTPFAFGSLEWVENIKSNYLAWPKQDRRESSRRCEERRDHDRRHQQLTENMRSLQKYSTILLTREELKLIEDLYKSELDIS